MGPRVRNVRVTLAAVAAGAALAVAACSSGSEGTSPTTTPAGPPAEEGTTTPLTRARVEEAVAQLRPYVEEALAATGVPGAAIGVVFDDQVVALEGFGVRELGRTDPVDAETVFPLASVSKPLASTVVAALVGQGVLAWDDPVAADDPAFALADPWVTEHVTYADLFAHRSGLPDHAGDVLETLGFDRAAVLERLRLEPLDAFRASYWYTNFGLTEAAVTAAARAGLSWEDASQQLLYGPLGMTATSSRYDDLVARANRALPHVQGEGGTWAVGPQRQPDAQSPAGGASSNVTDLARWLRLQLNGGTVDGRPVVDQAALATTHLPHAVASPPRSYDGRTGSYGLGWNVGTDDAGRVEWSHSGAFALGAATAVNLVPAEGLGIVTLTNGQPLGLPESVNRTFLDLVFAGEPSRDWLALYGPAIASQFATPDPAYAQPPAQPAPARAPAAYVGTYANAYYGPLVVKQAGGGLVASIGPGPVRWELAHHDGDTFTFVPSGEEAVGRSAMAFSVGPDGTATSVEVPWLDGTGWGTFERS